MASRVRFENLSKSASELVEMLQEGRLAIPPHQREFCWSEIKQQRFIDTVLKGLPTSSILLREERGELPSLEDGRQRLTTLMNFFKPDSTLRTLPSEGGRLYTELSAADRRQMDNYSFAVVRYSNATPAQVVEIFDRAQNGLPLNVGQRMYSLAEISPLVKYAKRTLLTAGLGLHDRAMAVWGARNGADKNRNIFKNAVVLAMMSAFGEATKKWEEIMEKRFLSREDINEEYATSLLTKLIEIYERAEVRKPARGKAMLNRQWDIGNFSAPILWSLRNFPDEHERLLTGWVNFIVRYRDDDSLLNDVLKRDVSAARSWNDQRWRFAYLRVFAPESSELPTHMFARDSDETDDDSL